MNLVREVHCRVAAAILVSSDEYQVLVVEVTAMFIVL